MTSSFVTPDGSRWDAGSLIPSMSMHWLRGTPAFAQRTARLMSQPTRLPHDSTDKTQGNGVVL